MSNYNETIQQHNTSLQALIDVANALPEAGSGASVETCTVSINDNEVLINCHFTGTILNEQGNISPAHQDGYALRDGNSYNYLKNSSFTIIDESFTLGYYLGNLNVTGGFVELGGSSTASGSVVIITLQENNVIINFTQ